jgi:hypothetical protein
MEVLTLTYIKESNGPINSSGFIKKIEVIDGKTKCDVLSGEYEFSTPLLRKPVNDI